MNDKITVSLKFKFDEASFEQIALLTIEIGKWTIGRIDSISH